ncbi:hypothetical protein CB1_000293019 [Camelus ferus]|nr:hypothetical protein CB1_000293019 [Camelus ferus]
MTLPLLVFTLFCDWAPSPCVVYDWIPITPYEWATCHPLYEWATVTLYDELSGPREGTAEFPSPPLRIWKVRAWKADVEGTEPGAGSSKVRGAVALVQLRSTDGQLAGLLRKNFMLKPNDTAEFLPITYGKLNEILVSHSAASLRSPWDAGSPLVVTPRNDLGPVPPSAWGSSRLRGPSRLPSKPAVKSRGHRETPGSTPQALGHTPRLASAALGRSASQPQKPGGQTCRENTGTSCCLLFTLTVCSACLLLGKPGPVVTLTCAGTFVLAESRGASS